MSHLYGDICIQRICEAAGINKINATENVTELPQFCFL